MSGYMTDDEFLDKMDYEGGIWDALWGCGMRSTDLIDQDSKLAKAFQVIERMLETKEVHEALQYIDSFSYDRE